MTVLVSWWYPRSMSPTDEPQSAARPSAPRPLKVLWHVARRILVFLTIYTLSIGPMFWHWYAGVHADGSKLVVAFYMPLLYACEIEPIGDFVNWYINLWIL